MVDASSTISVIGALGIGSFIGQYLIGSQQRRQVRSAVLQHLELVESARWAGQQAPGSPDFRSAMRDLETAALVARVPRKAVMHYKLLAYTGLWLSAAAAEDDADLEYSGGIDAGFDNVVRAAAGELSRLVWSPWLGRLRLATRLKAQATAIEDLNDSSIEGMRNRAAKYLSV